MAASVGLRDDRGRLVIRCMIPTDQPVRLKAVIVVGIYTGINDANFGEDRAQAELGANVQAPSPVYLETLWSGRRTQC